MSLLDTLRDTVNKILPRKDGNIPIPLSSSGGGHVVHEDDLIISKPAIVFHAFQIFFVFLAMCCFAAVASFQAKWGVGPSGLSGFAIFISIFALIDSAFLLAIPVMYEKYDKAIRLARALREHRVQFILTGAGIVTIFLISFITTISAWTEPGCKDPATDPNASLGDEYKSELPGWCQTKEAGAVFFWLGTIFYGASFALTFLDWRKGKSTYGGNTRDPPFTHPHDASQDIEEEEVAFPRREAPTRGNADEAASPFGDENRYDPPVSRPSMDAYGAFSDPAPTGYGQGAQSGGAPVSPVSRTMQYADPYAAVRGRIAQAGGAAAAPTAQPPSYDYLGYR